MATEREIKLEEALAYVMSMVEKFPGMETEENLYSDIRKNVETILADTDPQGIPRRVVVENAIVECHGGVWPPHPAETARVFNDYPETHNQVGTLIFIWNPKSGGTP